MQQEIIMLDQQIDFSLSPKKKIKEDISGTYS